MYQSMQQCLKAGLFGDADDWQCDQQEQILFQIKLLLEWSQAEELGSYSVEALDL